MPRLFRLFFSGEANAFLGNKLPPLRYHCLFLRHHGIEEFFLLLHWLIFHFSLLTLCGGLSDSFHI